MRICHVRSNTRHRLIPRASPSDDRDSSVTVEGAPSSFQTQTQTHSEREHSNGVTATASNPSTSASTKSADGKDIPDHLKWVLDVPALSPRQYQAPTASDKFWTSLKLIFALPWRRFKKESVLTIKVCYDDFSNTC